MQATTPFDDLEFPRHVHAPRVAFDVIGESRIVRSPAECAAALAEGFTLVPVLLTPVESAPPPAATIDHEPELEPPPIPAEPKKRGWPLGKPRKAQP